MARRNKRHSELFPSDAEKLVEELGRLHGRMMVLQRRVMPGSPHYLAIDELSEAVISTIRAVAGRDPEWMELKISETAASGKPGKAGE